MNVTKLPSWRVCLLAVMATPPLSLHAQTAAKLETSKQPAACVLPKGRDVLLKLMQCCTRDLASDRDCREYDPVNKYVIIKDNAPSKPAAFLLIPSEKVRGIDDKRIFKTPYLNLWANAWDQSERYPGWGDHRIGMAINSAHARTQDQLHVHISCIDAKVAEILDRHEKNAKPHTVQLPPANNTYNVTTVNDLTDGQSPFQIARQIPDMGKMADKSVAVVKSKEPGRYYVLTTAYKDSKGGAAEELLDQRCGVNP
ncbi:CDP-diacylglycerol diphosphatase [Edaphobacter modestus]|uniref:CDP-diacylglycerol pyrophosphatase n=1 Tax=Edaphobacter modestus TaxID=388466 RepID=A0A4Q7YQR2_9BACT|nr:CDP-diacylglycerol diphosphatase [Edaphobacter modestus]RZU39810.1 CDP-diacylglycerol pyrophosphatase [Edaphobacter modestus]